MGEDWEAFTLEGLKYKVSGNQIAGHLQNTQTRAITLGWVRHSSYAARFPWEKKRKKRGINWRKDQAKAKRRGKIHLNRAAEFMDDIPF